MSILSLLTRKQILFIIGLNAAISLVISLIVGLLLIRPNRAASTPAPTKAALATPGAAAVTPTAAPVVHVVQSGDTISGLALKYDVPEEDIIAANQLENPNFLTLGMELIIPVGGLPQITPTWTPQPTPTETDIPFEPPSVNQTATALAEAGVTATGFPTQPPVAGEIQIQITEVVAPGNADREAVVIANKGKQVVDMQGWTLSDAGGNVYAFPSFRLYAGGSVTVNTRIGVDGPNQLYLNKLTPIWTVGEQVTLKDTADKAVAIFTVK
ncbi:MAG: lamin tail domain-containing protein [Anaerolineae bacterium]|nr:lamin tail domain-containing protein [Anaerolineae bacterium]